MHENQKLETEVNENIQVIQWASKSSKWALAPTIYMGLLQTQLELCCWAALFSSCHRPI